MDFRLETELVYQKFSGSEKSKGNQRHSHISFFLPVSRSICKRCEFCPSNAHGLGGEREVMEKKIAGAEGKAMAGGFIYTAGGSYTIAAADTMASRRQLGECALRCPPRAAGWRWRDGVLVAGMGCFLHGIVL